MKIKHLCNELDKQKSRNSPSFNNSFTILCLSGNIIFIQTTRIKNYEEYKTFKKSAELIGDIFYKLT